MKKNEHPVPFPEFEAIYLTNLQAGDRPSAYEAYLRTEAAIEARCGVRKFATYVSFRNVLSRSRRAKGEQRPPDKKETLTAVLTVVNTYVCTIDYPFLVRYQQEISRRAQQMEVFGPMNGTYNAAELQQLKTTEAALSHLIKYIEIAAK